MYLIIDQNCLISIAYPKINCPAIPSFSADPSMDRAHIWGESTKHGPLVHGPRPWTGSMDHLFLLSLKIVVIKDYERVLRLWYNLNSCLLLKSLYLRTAKIKIYRQKVCRPQKLELSAEESLQMGSPNWFYSHACFCQFLIFFITLLPYFQFWLRWTLNYLWPLILNPLIKVIKI